jgi:transcriptional regulator with XRE-family HTH domain
MDDELTILARVLKKTRTERRWTLADVAARSGISVTTLSKVERGIHSLTYEKIIELARGLGVEIGSLFHDETSAPAVSARRSLNRAGEGVHSVTEALDCTYLHTDLLNKAFNPVFYEFKARSLKEFGPMTAHDGEQIVYVLEGAMEIHTEHYEPVRLYAGDSFYFDSRMRHAAFKIGDGPCRLFGALSALDTRGADAIRTRRTLEFERRPRATRDASARREKVEAPAETSVRKRKR